MPDNRNNSSWCCDKIEEKIKEYEKELELLKTQKHYGDFSMTFGKRIKLEEVIKDLKEILYN